MHQKPGLEISHENTAIGQDPRKMVLGDLETLGHKKTRLLTVIRERCIDCSGGSPSEVRMCVATKCVSWPYRMGTDPWRIGRKLSDDERKAAGERLNKARKLNANPTY